MTEPGTLPEGYTVDAVDWLPSGARSGLVRVRGHRPPAVAGPLPELILETGGESRRYVSLPDPRADRDPTAWRGAYVLEAQPAAEADRLWLEWPGARRIALPSLSVPEHQVARSAEAEEHPASPHGEVVVDRAVLAERRARRAEASEQAQARISREALRAVEVLELRMAELEQRAMLAEGERDTLRDQAEPGPRHEGQNEEILGLRAALAEREAEIARRPASAATEPARITAGEAERRAERLRGALTATIATVAELRMRVHELQVARRTRDVAAAADAVRLVVLERDQAVLQAEFETARGQLQGALHARDEAAVALEGMQAAHEELRAQFSEASAELGAARERIADLEGEVAAAAAVAEQVDDAEALRARLEEAESAIVLAETARELAEASALAAASRHHAAEVARAAGESAPGSRNRGYIHHEATQASAAPAPRVPESLLAAAAEAERAAAQRQPTEESERVVADLAAASAALRAAEAGAEPRPIAEPRPHVSFDPVFVSAPTDPPGDVARGRESRDYPPLRGALVKLAHDDPAAAGRILAGLLRAQHAVLDGTVEYDVTIAEVGTFAVSPSGDTTSVSAVESPRGRPHAAFHLQMDALTFAESIAGVEARPRRRRGPLRASGKVRAARKLTESLRTDASLSDLMRAGAEIEPELALRALAYAVRPAWIQGQEWLVEITVEDRPLTVAARHSGGLSVGEGPAQADPDARLRLSAEGFRGLVAGDAAEPVGEGDERVLRRLFSLAERARTGTP